MASPSSTPGKREVDCISKCKTRTPYEFGVKVGVACTLQGNLIVGSRAFQATRMTATLCTSNWSRRRS